MSGLPQSFIQDLISRCDIVEIIQARVPLKKGGKNYKACCPFHTEKSPSFSVNPIKQFYYCFGCGASGDVIEFIKQYDRLEFPDAIELLANHAGMEIPTTDDGPKRDTRPLFDITDKASAFYCDALKQHTPAIQYLRDKRKLTGHIAKRFALGYAHNQWDALIKQLGTESTALNHLIETGLVIHKDNKQYDRFRDRIMFPIRDMRGRTIGFGGRILDQGEPKYLNSPETPLFHKNQALYGLYEMLQTKAPLNEVLIVEGYMDVIGLHQHNVTNVVASLGTATNPKHLQILFRHTKTVVFCFDGDKAGTAAAWRALTTNLPILRDGIDIQFMFLSNGEDPDTYIQKYGKAGFESQIKAAIPLADFLFKQCAVEIPLDSAANKAAYADKVRALLDTMPAGTYQQLLYQQLAKILRLEVDQVHAIAPLPSRPKHTEHKPVKAGQPLTPIQITLSMLLKHPELASLESDWSFLSGFHSQEATLLASVASACSKDHTLTVGHLLAKTDDPDSRQVLASLSARPDILEDRDLSPEFLASILKLRTQSLAQSIDLLIEKSKSHPLSTSEKSELQALLQEQNGQKALADD